MNPVNTTATASQPSANVVHLVAPQRMQRSCYELGVCLHPSASCTKTCRRVEAMQPVGGLADMVAAPTRPFGVEGPYRERMTRGDRWRLGVALAAGAVTSLALVYVLGAFVLKPLVQGAVVLLARVGG
ncbi:MAG: hypothetical protein U1E02_25205 [Hydrogenophaga sp.]|nr:hypothetical protein [Hydrogenophaga sp.]MDZ4127433.1 hypothetical protein [Hydrogenophaga sp.]